MGGNAGGTGPKRKRGGAAGGSRFKPSGPDAKVLQKMIHMIDEGKGPSNLDAERLARRRRTLEVLLGDMGAEIPVSPAQKAKRAFNEANKTILGKIRVLDDKVDGHLQMAAAMRGLGDRTAEIDHMSRAYAGAEEPDRLRKKIGQRPRGVERQYGFS